MNKGIIISGILAIIIVTTAIILLSNDKFRKGWSGSGTTVGDGTITFQLSNARSGCYTTILNSVTSDPSWDGTQPQDVGYCKH